ncbi:hypothetical protein DSECCO2_544170 [anaerobic digester metagenome]
MLLFYDFRGERKRFQGVKISIIYLLSDDFNVLLIATKLYICYRLDFKHLGDNIFIVRWNQLPAIAPVYLVPIVFFRVM